MSSTINSNLLMCLIVIVLTSHLVDCSVNTVHDHQNEMGKHLTDAKATGNANGTDENNLAIRLNYFGKSLTKFIPVIVQIKSTFGDLYKSVIDPVPISETIKSRPKRQSMLISILGRFNWKSLLVKVIKTLIEFMVDVAAAIILGKAAIASPLNVFE